MTQFAPVAPIQVLEQLYAYDPWVFGEYHLLLAHHTVENLKRFEELFAKIATDGIIHPLIIMDNSVVECGGFVDFDMMRQATAIINNSGHEVIPVLPDVMGKGQETREATLMAYSRWEHGIPCAGFMGVCQGESWDDYCVTVDLFSNRARFPFMEFLGIPRILVETLGTRRKAVPFTLSRARMSDMKVHLLGYSDDTFDDLDCSRAPGVAGIDSAVPLRVPSKFVFGMEAGLRPPDWFEMAQITPQMITNLLFVRGAHNHYDPRS